MVLVVIHMKPCTLLLFLVYLWTKCISKVLFRFFLDEFSEVRARRISTADQLNLLKAWIALPLTLQHLFLVIALQALNFVGLPGGTIVLVILQSLINTEFFLI